jgi:hypothetical protein
MISITICSGFDFGDSQWRESQTRQLGSRHIYVSARPSNPVHRTPTHVKFPMWAKGPLSLASRYSHGHRLPQHPLKAAFDDSGGRGICLVGNFPPVSNDQGLKSAKAWRSVKHA